MKLGKVFQSSILASCLAVFLLTCLTTQSFGTVQTITFGGLSFSPSTMNVSTGDTIVWSGSFANHIIQSTSVPSGANTFGPTTTSTTSFSYIVTVAGTYNYQCNIHAGAGMTGSFTATAPAVKSFSLSTTVVAFGNLRAGSSKNSTVTLTSNGPDAALTISSSPLSVGTMYTNSPTGANRSIAVNSSETETITFSPTGRGTYYDTLTINNNATTTTDQAKKIYISGTGINGVYSGATSIDFDKVRVGNNKQLTYTITNAGDDTLFLSAPNLSGAGFSLVSGSAQNILPSGTASVVIKFSPVAKQAFSGTLTMTAQNGVSVPTITITGTGTSPILTPLPAASYDLGLTRVGTTLSGSVQVSNTGDDTLHVTGVSIPNSQQGAKFSLTSTSSFNVLPSASSNITFTYTSSSESIDAATLNLTGDDGAGTRQIALSARSGLPKMSVSTKDTVDFGSSRIGTPAGAFLTINNIGTYDLAVQMTDFSPSVFSLGVLTSPIPPQGTTQAAILFTPTAEGPVTGMAIVQGDDNSNPRDTIYFKGAGINTALDFPSSVDFHQLNINKTSDTVLKLINHGTAGAKILKYTLTDVNKGFAIVDTSAHTLAANDSVTIKVRFAPTKEIDYAAVLTILTDDNASPSRQISLAGVGINSKLLTNPTSLDFGTIDSGVTSTKTFRITNTGTAATTLVSIKTTGDTSFTMAPETVPLQLAAGAGKDISVTFAPTANGTFDGAVAITASEGSPLSVSLHGKGHVTVIIKSVANPPHNIGLQMAVYPNPSNGAATIRLTLEKPLNVSLALFDATGKMVQEFKNAAYNSGMYTIPFASESLPSGEYYLRAVSDNATAAELKVMIVR